MPNSSDGPKAGMAMRLREKASSDVSGVGSVVDMRGASQAWVGLAISLDAEGGGRKFIISLTAKRGGATVSVGVWREDFSKGMLAVIVISLFVQALVAVV